MTEPVQVFEGSDAAERADRVHAMVSYLIKSFPWKFKEDDRPVLMERTDAFLDRLEEAKRDGRQLSMMDLVNLDDK